jgi:hypothetical protein
VRAVVEQKRSDLNEEAGLVTVSVDKRSEAEEIPPRRWQ